MSDGRIEYERACSRVRVQKYRANERRRELGLPEWSKLAPGLARGTRRMIVRNTPEMRRRVWVNRGFRRKLGLPLLW
jgi:hypothetical protein